MAVVARIVEQLDGQLRVASKPSEGSRFSFLVPVSVPGHDRRTSQEVSPDLTFSRPDGRRAFGSQGSFGSRSVGSELDSIVGPGASSKSPVPDSDATHEVMNTGHDHEHCAPVQSEMLKVRKKRVTVTKPRMGAVEFENSDSRGAKVGVLELDTSSTLRKNPETAEIWLKTPGDTEELPPRGAVSCPRPITDQASPLRVLIVEVWHAPLALFSEIYALVSRMMQ